MIRSTKYIPGYMKGRSGTYLASFRIFDLGIPKIYSFEFDPSQQDAFAIFSDWKMVGEDIGLSVQRFGQELSKK